MSELRVPEWNMRLLSRDGSEDITKTAQALVDRTCFPEPGTLCTGSGEALASCKVDKVQASLKLLASITVYTCNVQHEDSMASAAGVVHLGGLNNPCCRSPPHKRVRRINRINGFAHYT